jgi:hypothetical protein
MTTGKLITTVVSSVRAVFVVAGCSAAPGENNGTSEDGLTKVGGGAGGGSGLNVCSSVALATGGIPGSYVDPTYPAVTTFIEGLAILGCRGTGGDTAHVARAVAKANDSGEWWMESECPVAFENAYLTLVKNPTYNAYPIRATVSAYGSEVVVGTQCQTVTLTSGYFAVDFDPGCPGCGLTTPSGGKT